MYTTVVVGSDADAAAERLVSTLDGRVGVVREAADPADGSTAVGATTYTLGDGWRADGGDLSVDGALDRLAPDHDYALVVGVDGVRGPTVVAGDYDDDPENLLAAAERAADLDAEQIQDGLQETEPYETLESLVAAVKRSPDADYAGAIATFTGRVRAKEDADDERTRFLEFEKYDAVADERMDTIATELEQRDGVFEVLLHHRTGRVPDGEDIVFVVVLAGHRDEAFRTVEDGINRLKDEVPLFKKEVTEAETFWVHERDDR
ncbi:molybdopterin synthase catalytic subunit [Natronomonas pharaonis DSM 2160]|uniref:Molybdopterin synthase catalytic subunit n=1 Tax=Natronomonas pharaonis (strain ATCC 35678 / DSM 2160 / CIP 103997 / JCM 8858 / NBRC 14720 / NCIMB 2260 / Gabara) TaxID=348780 RepID=A0A1U7EVY5_NATPD|nr:molybdopterin synthase [Natronomonas pharaonis]CAI49228.1 molybdopterin synthase catalytic subunit [Natronomonas pharaonis DSM 2160]